MKRLVLTEGDVDLFYFLWMVRVMTIDQTRRVRYFQPETGRLSSLDNVRKRLARLSHGGYLTAQDILQEDCMKLMRVYLLGDKALEPLRHRYAIGQRRLYRLVAGKTLQFLHHALWVSEVAVRIAESLRGTDIRTPALAPLGAPYYHTHAVADARKRRHTERYVTQEDITIPGEGRPGRVRPDLVFALQVDGVAQLYFLEADRGFEGHQQIAEKLRAYCHYRRQLDGQCPDRFLWQRYSAAARECRVLFVTTTPRRIESLQRSLKGTPGFGMTAFASFDDVRARNTVLDPIWSTATGLHPLTVS